MHEWINLTARHGDTIEKPSVEQMKSVLQDLFSDRDEEHPDCWLQCGSQNGELVVLSVFDSGYAIFTRYADQDMLEELEVRRVPAHDVSTALALCVSLIGGHYEEI
ncbi:hypothetical protein [Pseudomonas sp. B28(2017)]|uniref:hypothetical protein n=1 Tax=Pseudomonas sp. B28(2017) TaxID=1981730 RepID=UPI000A1F3423|nr:hypothetical protein [Pseudomonas sp. B28(2017)]